MDEDSTKDADRQVLGDMPSEDFRRFGYRIVDWIADYLEHPERFPVLAQVQPGDILSRLPAGAPDQPEVGKWWGKNRIGAQGTDGFAEVLTNGGWRAVTKSGGWQNGEGASNHWRLSVVVEDNQGQRVSSNEITLTLVEPFDALSNDELRWEP